MRHSTLLARIKRAEARRSHHRARSPVIYAIHPADDPPPVLGLLSGSMGATPILREPGEPEAAFRERALAAIDTGIWCWLYEPTPEPAKVAAPLPDMPDTNPKPFPWHKAGVGVVDERYLGWHESNAGMIERGNG